jgi:hypothetical protein
MTYTLTKDWTGDMYWDITLGWDYEKCKVDISMPGYIKKKCKNMNMSIQKNHSIDHTDPSPNNLAAKPNGLSPATSQNFSTIVAKNASRKLLEAFHTTPGPST